MTEEVECFVTGCPFVVDLDDREAMEQHVRWIHLPENDFGEDPLPALTGFMLNGLIRPDEFAGAVQAVLSRALDDVRARTPMLLSARLMHAALALILALGFVALLAIGSKVGLIERLPLMGAIGVGVALLIDSYREW